MPPGPWHLLGTWTILTACVWNSKEEASPLDFLLQFTSVKLNADAAGQAVGIHVQLCMYRGGEMLFWHLQRQLTKNRLKPMNPGVKVIIP